MSAKCSRTGTLPLLTHIERTHYLRHSLRSLGGDNNPCEHVGTCEDQINGFICHYPPGITGKFST